MCGHQLDAIRLAPAHKLSSLGFGAKVLLGC